MLRKELNQVPPMKSHPMNQVLDSHSVWQAVLASVGHFNVLRAADHFPRGGRAFCVS